MAAALASALRDEIGKMLAPLRNAALAPSGWTRLLASLGHVPGGDVSRSNTLITALQQCATALEQLQAIDDNALGSLDGVARVVSAAASLYGAVRAVERAVTDPALASLAADLGLELTNFLCGLYLKVHHPRIHRAAALLTLVEPAETPSLWRDERMVRQPWRREQLHLERIGDLLKDPWSTLGQFYFVNGLAAPVDAHASANRLFPPILELAQVLGVHTLRDFLWLGPPPPPPPAPTDVVEELDHLDVPRDVEETPPGPPPDLSAFYQNTVPRVVLALPQLDGTGTIVGSRLALQLLLSSPAHPGGAAGLVITPLGLLEWTEEREGWRLGLHSEGSIPAFVIGPGGLSLAPAALGGANGKFSVERVAAAGTPAFVFGSATGSRLELGAVRFGVDFTLRAAQRSLGVTVDVDQAKLVLAGGDGDGLLKKLLPRDGVELACNLGVRLSSDGGLELGVSVNGASLGGEMPVGRSIGPIRIESLRRDFHPVDNDQGTGLTAAIGARLSTQLGPVALSLEGPSLGVDVLWRLKDPARAPNLGVAHLDGLGVRPPTGASLVVDGALVQGGGALIFDPQRHQYAGALELTIRDRIGLEVLGLLATRLPDGKEGFSLLVLGSATFPGIPIGFGFSLAGLGALVGVHRSISVDAIKSALLAGHLDSALFPTDPAAHMATLLGTLDTMFPPRESAFSVGILARITWGPNALAKLDLGLFYDTSAPARLIALAQLLVEAPLVRLRLQALGVLDFDEGELDLQARLFDSRIIGFDVSGDAALMLRWGSSPAFVMSIGGFHPAFQPPTEFAKRFPPLRRITIRPHMDDSILKLSLTAYLALTSNTVQFGARVELGVDVSAFSVEGMLAFDALVQFSPKFWFDVRIEGGVSLKVLGASLLGAHFHAELTGPHPWWAKGTATIEILWWDVDYDFEVGARTAPPEGATMAVSEALATLGGAFADGHNWSSRLSGDHAALAITRRPTSSSTLTLHPLDELQVRNTVMPLGLPVERLDERPLEATFLFDISNLAVAGGQRDRQPLQDSFARSRYQKLTEAQKLSAPSFETMRAGASALPAATAVTPSSVSVSFTWEEKLWAPEETPIVALPANIVDAGYVLAISASAEAPLRRTGTARYRLGARP